MIRISVNKIANSKIDGYNVSAYVLDYNCISGMDFADIPGWRYVLLVYKNKTNFRDVMVEIREKDDYGNINQIPPELIKSIIPPRMKDNYYELNGVAYIRDLGDNKNNWCTTINKYVVTGSCGYRFILNYGKYLPIMKKWHNAIHTYEEVDEVYTCLCNIMEFKYQIDEDGYLNTRIAENEERISKLLNEISECDKEISELHNNYDNSIHFIGSYGIDTKPFEIVE